MVGGRWLVGGGGGGFLCVLVFFLFLLVVLVLMVEEDGENVIFGVGAATKGLRFFVPSQPAPLSLGGGGSQCIDSVIFLFVSHAYSILVPMKEVLRYSRHHAQHGPTPWSNPDKEPISLTRICLPSTRKTYLPDKKV